MRLTVDEFRALAQLAAADAVDTYRFTTALRARVSDLEAELSQARAAAPSPHEVNVATIDAIVNPESLVDAAKAFRNLTGCTLKDAKDWVEHNHPKFMPRKW